MVGRIMFHTNEYLHLVQDTLHYLKSLKAPILSTKEECDYFRKLFKTSKQKTPILIPAPKKEEVVQRAVPLPLPIKEPNVVEKVVEKVIEIGKIKEEKKRDPIIQENIPPLHFSFGKWKAICGKIAPDLLILSEIPTDAIAKNIAARWKTKNLSAPITILFIQEVAEHKTFLEQIAIALDVHFVPAKLVHAEPLEKEGKWETFLSNDLLKLLIICDYTLWQMPKLLKLYKETKVARFLGDKTLFLLPDLSLYLKDPLLKRSLWKALCQTYTQLLSQSSSTKI